MEKTMNLKRALLILTAALLMPGLVFAQSAPGPESFTARFAVVKFFLDQNPADVTVNLVCNTGTDREQTAEISGLLGGDNLVVFVNVFVNEEMLPGPPNIFWCDVFETNQPNGYVPLYLPFELAGATTEDYQAIAEAHHGDYPTSCRYEGAEGEDLNPTVEDLIENIDHIGPIQELNVCVIINVPHPVEVDVRKIWDVTGAGDGGDKYSKETTIRVKSDWILDGDRCHKRRGGGYGAEEDSHKDDCVFLQFNGNQTKSVWVWPFYNPGNDDVDDGIPVYFEEMGMDSAYEVTSTCGNGKEGVIRVRVGDSSAGCTFTNTLFFEGIPTLSQYGLAIMALLMLGVGFVGFRRFV
jgi:hypothetical protein